NTHRCANDAERRLVREGGETSPPRVRVTLQEFFRLFQNRGLVLLTISYGAVNYVQYMFFYWLEYYFTQGLLLPKKESRDAAFLVTMAMAVGMACGGWVSDWLCRRFGQTMGSRMMAMGGMGLCMVFSLLGVNTQNTREVLMYFSLSLG